jgi:hypothetical protein
MRRVEAGWRALCMGGSMFITMARREMLIHRMACPAAFVAVLPHLRSEMWGTRIGGGLTADFFASLRNDNKGYLSLVFRLDAADLFHAGG